MRFSCQTALWQLHWPVVGVEWGGGMTTRGRHITLCHGHDLWDRERYSVVGGQVPLHWPAIVDVVANLVVGQTVVSKVVPTIEPTVVPTIVLS